MGELLAVLLALGVVLVFVTLVGHGIWVLVAAAFRAISNERPSAPRTTEADDVEAILRQLARLRSRGVLNELRYRELRQLLTQSSSQGAARPAPAAAERRAAPTPTPMIDQRAGEEEPVLADVVFDEPEAPRREEGRRLEPARPKERQPAPAAPSQPHATPPSEEVASPLRRRRALADMLLAFMEDRNIRWGELISGMLIVVCSVGLVVSLRATLSDKVPYFPAMLFMLGTGALHGAGLYTLRKWDLRATSRGILTIASLLVPLNFLAAIVLSGPEASEIPVGSAAYIAAVAVGLSAFGAMSYFASRALVRRQWQNLWMAVMIPSAGQLFISRLAREPISATTVYLLLALPLAGYLAATLGELVGAARRRRISAQRGERLCLVVGVALFSFAAAVGLLVSRSADWGETFARLSPVFSLAAAVLTAAGLLLHHRTLARRLAALRTAGSAIAVFGALCMLVALALAWPRPELLIAVGLTNFGVLLLLAMGGRLPLLHAPALACLAMSLLIGFHLWQGAWVDRANLGRELAMSLLMGRSSLMLLAIAGAGLAAGGLFQRVGRNDEARVWQASAGGLAAIGGAIALWVGFTSGPDALLAAGMTFAAALAALTASFFVQRAAAAWTASVALLLALVQALVFNQPAREALFAFAGAAERPLLLAFLLHAILLAGVCGIARRSMASRRDEKKSAETWLGWISPLMASALATATAAACLAIFVEDRHFVTHAMYLAGAAGVWLLGAVLHRRAEIFAAFEALALLALSFAVVAVCQRQPWWTGHLLLPRHLLWQPPVLAAACVVARTATKTMRQTALGRDLAAPGTFTVHDAVLGAASAVLPALLWLACWPGVAVEMGYDSGGGQWLNSLDEAARGVGWISWLAVLSACAAAFLLRPRPSTMFGLAALALSSAPLAAVHWSEAASTASALRWSCALLGLVGVGLLCTRRRLSQLARRLHPELGNVSTEATAANMSSVLGALTAAPVLLLTIFAIIRAVDGAAIALSGDSLFAEMGILLNYGGPLLAVLMMLVAQAVRERSPAAMLAGSVLLQGVAALAVLLPIVLAGDRLTEVSLVALAQWSAVACGGFTLLWLALRRWIDPSEDHPAFLQIQYLLLAVALAIPTAWTLGEVIFDPGARNLAKANLGQWPGYAAWLLALAAAVGALRSWPPSMKRPSLSPHAAGGLAVALLALASATASRFAPPSDWLDWRVLTGGIGLLAAAGMAAGSSRRFGTAAAGWSTALSAALVALALPTVAHDPWMAWPAGVLGVAALLLVGLGLVRRSQWFAYGSLAAAPLAAWAVWMRFWPAPIETQHVLHLFDLVLATLVVGGAWWLAVEIWSQRRRGSLFDPRFALPRASTTAPVFAAGGLLLLSAGGMALASLARPWGGADFDISNIGGWITVFLLTLVLVGSLWDRAARHTALGLYAVGLAALTMGVDEFELSPRLMAFAFSVGLAIYIAFTSLVYNRLRPAAPLASRLGISGVESGLSRTRVWLLPVNFLMAMVVAVWDLAAVLTFPERELRIAAGFTPALLAAAAALSTTGEGRASERGRFNTLALLTFSAVCLSWADIPQAEALWLARLVRLLVVLSAATFLYALLIPRGLSAQNRWLPALRSAALTAGAGALLSLVLVLAAEAIAFQPQVGAPLNLAQVSAVAALMVVLAAGLIAIALWPESASLEWTENRRMLCVYAAEVVAVLIFVHLKLARPTLFSGLLRPYWPYVVMAIAFASVGVGEMFRRSGVRVLAEPLGRTGGLLPLLPALGVWIVAVEGGANYALLMFVVGVLYALLAMLRGSLLSGIAAAVAGNVAIWAFWDRLGWEFFIHPQFWLIPPALSALAGAQLNRDRLSEAQLTAVRYLSMLVIYISSTGEIFMRGVGESLWPPIVLASLAVGGVLLGIVLRIRAFLYSGAAFLLLAVVSMVWHAAESIDKVWPWWAFGIGLGIALLVLFGLFEKNRAEIHSLADRLRAWEH